MRSTLRLLASVKPARYLTPGAPTGLAGLPTHTSPRSTLLFLYNSTLEKLQAAPENSVYRQSVEAITRHRKAIIEAQTPPGYEAWAERARKLLAENPAQFSATTPASIDGADAAAVQRGGDSFVIHRDVRERDIRENEWDGEIDEGPELEGTRTHEERRDFAASAHRRPLEDQGKVQWEPEPQLTVDQVEEIETKIGSGLIEEVIQVAEGELRLVDIMLEAKPWEELEEKPAEGQWTYFERDQSKVQGKA